MALPYYLKVGVQPSEEKINFQKKETRWEPVNNWNPVWKIQFADVIVTDPFKLQRVVVLVRKKFILG